MHRAMSFLISMSIVVGVAAYGLREVGRRAEVRQLALQPLAESILKKLLETPGNWSRMPPDPGLCIEGEEGALSYVIDQVKLRRLASMSEEELEEAFGLKGKHARIAVYVWSQQLGRFQLYAEAGARVRRAGASARSPAAIGLGEELRQALVEVEVWGG